MVTSPLERRGAPARCAPLARRWSALAAVLAASALSGCLYTTQHFNSGRLLEPGETAVTVGMGRAHAYAESCPDGYEGYRPDPDKNPVCASIAHLFGGPAQENEPGAVPGTGADSIRPMGLERVTSLKMSVGYRLGVRKRWGPFKGIEIGWGVEGPTNPVTLEFDVKAGLPIPDRWKVSHSLSAGWGVGAWVDNSWFLEYAASRSFGRDALFCNYRYTRVATQPEDIDTSLSEGRFIPLPGNAHQFGLGWYQRLPDVPVLPDYLVPEMVATLPVHIGEARVPASAKPSVDVNFNLGFGWDF